MITSDNITKLSGPKNQITLPQDEGRTLLVELMHQGFDTYCSEVDASGNLTITWPASLATGKQLSQ